MVHEWKVLTLRMMLFWSERNFAGVALSIIGLTLVDLASHPAGVLSKIPLADGYPGSVQAVCYYPRGPVPLRGVAPTSVSYTLNSASIWLPGAFIPQPSFCIL